MECASGGVLVGGFRDRGCDSADSDIEWDGGRGDKYAVYVFISIRVCVPVLRAVRRDGRGWDIYTWGCEQGGWVGDFGEMEERALWREYRSLGAGLQVGELCDLHRGAGDGRPGDIWVGLEYR